MVINAGDADIANDAPSHISGINQGNAIGNYEKQKGHLPDGKRTAASATGIDPDAHGPIDPRMPNLPPP
jgi:hypothetical protein